MRVLTWLLACFSASNLFAQSLEQYPLYEKEKIQVKSDWLVKPIAQKAAVYRDQDGHLVLSNGLVSRIFSMEPDGATVALENLMDQSAMLRSVRPEAELVIDGMTFPIGGLTGQPIHNYLLPEWLEGMKANPLAFHLAEFSTRPTQPRFAWQKRMDWMPEDLPWPAPGVEVTFRYKADDELIDQLIARASSDENRKVILDDRFQKLSGKWKITASKADARNSFINEGKAGEIMALANTSVFADQKVPKGASVFVAKINPGTDQSVSWGPGIGLVYKNKVIKLNVRPGQKEFGWFDGEKEHTAKGMKEGQPVWLRIEQRSEEIVLGYSYDGNVYTSLASFAKSSGEVPEMLRVGKMAWDGHNSDHKKKGDRVRLLVEQVKILGAFSEASLQNQQAKFTYLKGLDVNVHYELYDGLPVFCKWITVENHSGKTVTIDKFKSEILAVSEPESVVDGKKNWLLPNITVDTDYRFGGMSNENVFESSIAWNPDPLYATQVNYERSMPCLLEAYPKYGPAKTLASGETFSSFRTWELFHQNRDRERKGLAQRRMYRAIAPWATENPILMHVRSADETSVKRAIDQCAEVGFEMVIMTFGSGFAIEDNSEEYLQRMKALADYAHAKGVALGGYSLLASRRIGGGHDVVMPEGKTPRFGNSPCLESEWGEEYFEKLYHFYQKTGQDILEHDGSYPGDVCASTSHPGHKGLADSQWEQFEKIRKFYEWCRGRGIYLNIPDHYFLNGGSKTGMGYRETNWSLPREQQEIIERQNIYDGTWDKTPSMGWMFVPLVQYHGGGAAATIEPLKEHLPHYGQRLANLFGAGVQACYRGPQLYDAPETKVLVKKWVDFYKKHRKILDGDIIHIRRPDGRDYDAILHVDPDGEEKGLLMVYNPLNKPIRRTLHLDLYYTGLETTATVIEQDKKKTSYTLSRDYTIELPVEIPARSQTWFVIQ
ncbi:hypothetical protein AAG747_11270 [Rapidithrix thailandica]|uniref:Alpha-galactosidase n=1 Tax=Rapidithrix thailandica TaxID=413964 RepID=A0AAW9SAY8_9BACT